MFAMFSKDYELFKKMIVIIHNPGSTEDECDKARNSLSVLSKKGFNVNKIYDPNHYGNNPLMWEIAYGWDIKPDGALIMLNTFQANPFICDKLGQKNALHFLLLKGREIQRCIFSAILNHHDIDKHINDKTVHGDTCLHIACLRRDEQYITQLLSKGADFNIKNNSGQTPIEMLYLTEEKRLEFLACEGYLDRAANRDLNYVATIDEKIFNSCPETIEQKIIEQTAAQSVIRENEIENNGDSRSFFRCTIL
jgi:hypothetical protein